MGHTQVGFELKCLLQMGFRSRIFVRVVKKITQVSVGRRLVYRSDNELVVEYQFFLERNHCPAECPLLDIPSQRLSIVA